MAGSNQARLNCNKDLSEPVCPAQLSGLIADLVIANFDHGRRQVVRFGMAAQRVVDPVGRRIGLVDADRERRVCLQVRE